MPIVGKNLINYVALRLVWPRNVILLSCVRLSKLGTMNKKTKLYFFSGKKKTNTQISSQSNQLLKYDILDSRSTARD